MTYNLTEELYQKYGAFSKKAGTVFIEACKLKNFTIHEITYSLGYAFKFITSIINEYDNIFKLHDDRYFLEKDDILEIKSQLIYKTISESEKEVFEKRLSNILPQKLCHKSDLDHVSCIPKTCIDRACELLNNFDSNKCNFLFLGDHDFTSVAFKMICPDAKITIIDIDNDILKIINSINGKNTLTLFSDFRLNIPQLLGNSFDIVFTDPPYTPEGMNLFLKRSIQCMKKNIYSCIYCAYGTSELSPSIGLAVQKIFITNHLYIDELKPKFNIYYKAEALGYRSDLYICRMTPKSWDQNNMIFLKNPKVYTHGKNSLESSNKNEVNSDFNIEEYLDSNQEVLLISDSTYKNLASNYKVKTIFDFFKNTNEFKQHYDNAILVDDGEYSYCIARLIMTINFDILYLITKADLTNNEQEFYLLNEIYDIKQIDKKGKYISYEILYKNQNEIVYNFFIIE